jgi:cytochrome b6-f complex iron-sulfur subunit
MADKPKSTADILAAIRKAPAGGEPAAAAPPEPAAAPPAAAAAAAPPTAPAPRPPAGEAPQGTSSILSAIRAQKGGGAATPAAPASKKPAAAPGGAAPAGTSSILSAIRGGGAASPAAAAEARPAAQAPAAKAPAGDRPSVQEMLRAVKSGVKAPEPGVRPTPARLPGGKPDVVVVKGGGKAAPSTRRSVFAPIVALVSTPFALAWTLMAFLGGVFTLKGAQFMMPNMVLELPSRFKVGVPSDFPLGSVSEKYKASRGVWIIHTDAYDGKSSIYALASVCTHLGCTPNWLEGEQKFKCPCHGSGFYISGINFEGPAPRPLERVGIRMAEDGQLEVDKSLKFQEELGQWADPKSYVA